MVYICIHINGISMYLYINGIYIYIYIPFIFFAALGYLLQKYDITRNAITVRYQRHTWYGPKVSGLTNFLR